MTLLQRLRRGLIEINRMRRVLGWRTALSFALRWALGHSGTVALILSGETVTLRYRYADWKVAYNSLGDEMRPVIDNVPAVQGALIIDAGGFIGTAAIRLARAFPDAKVVTLEPAPENYALLERNVATLPNIIPLNAALSNSSGTSLLRARDTGTWGFTMVEGVSTDVGEEVRTVTFEDILAMTNASRAAVIKMDIEGGEDVLLRDAGRWLPVTDALFIELHERIVPGVSDRFAAATRGRLNLRTDGEKILSIHPDVLLAGEISREDPAGKTK